MQIEEKEYLKIILELHSILEKVFFRDFEESSNFLADINHTHIKAMMFLKFEGEKPMSMVSNKLNMEKGSFTPVANHLIKLGFIDKVPDPQDKRIFKLRLNERGNTFINEVCVTHNSYVRVLFERLTEEEIDSYLKAAALMNDLTIKMQKNKKAEKILK